MYSSTNLSYFLTLRFFAIPFSSLGTDSSINIPISRFVFHRNKSGIFIIFNSGNFKRNFHIYTYLPELLIFFYELVLYVSIPLNVYPSAHFGDPPPFHITRTSRELHLGKWCVGCSGVWYICPVLACSVTEHDLASFSHHLCVSPNKIDRWM